MGLESNKQIKSTAGVQQAAVLRPLPTRVICIQAAILLVAEWHDDDGDSRRLIGSAASVSPQECLFGVRACEKCPNARIADTQK